MLWGLWLLLSSLNWTHHSSYKLIPANHAHRIYLLMATFRWWALNRICNWSRIIVSWFCTTIYIVRLYNYTIFTWNPRVTYGRVMIWLKLAITNAFTIVLIRVVLYTTQINRISIGWSSYISRRSHVLFVLQLLRHAIHRRIMWFKSSTHHQSFWTMAVAKTVLF